MFSRMPDSGDVASFEFMLPRLVGVDPPFTPSLIVHIELTELVYCIVLDVRIGIGSTDKGLTTWNTLPCPSLFIKLDRKTNPASSLDTTHRRDERG